MLRRGRYRVVQVLDISHSLLSQMDGSVDCAAGSMDECAGNSNRGREGDSSKGRDSTITKCLLGNSEGQAVAYLIGLPSLGQGSEILVLSDQEEPLLQACDIEIVEYKKYVHPLCFIKKLLFNRK